MKAGTGMGELRLSKLGNGMGTGWPEGNRFRENVGKVDPLSDVENLIFVHHTSLDFEMFGAPLEVQAAVAFSRRRTSRASVISGVPSPV